MAKIVRQFSIPAYDKPGTLAEVTEVLGKAGINLLGVTIDNAGVTAFIRFIVEQEDKVELTLKGAGFPVFSSQAFLVELPNEPGALGKLSKALSEAEINIETIYGTAFGKDAAKLIFVVSDLKKAEKVFEGFLSNVA